jgi:hypothetical protein
MTNERIYERKYYFGWYNWNGFIFCERWDANQGSSCGCFVKTEITEHEWNGPLSILEERYFIFQAGSD